VAGAFSFGNYPLDKPILSTKPIKNESLKRNRALFFSRGRRKGKAMADKYLTVVAKQGDDEPWAEYKALLRDGWQVVDMQEGEPYQAKPGDFYTHIYKIKLTK